MKDAFTPAEAYFGVVHGAVLAGAALLAYTGVEIGGPAAMIGTIGAALAALAWSVGALLHAPRANH